MKELIIYFLATTGFVMITNKSALFKGIRMYITSKYIEYENKKLIHNQKTFGIGVLWWLENIFSCSLCMSPYAGTICTLLLWGSYYYPVTLWIMYPMAAVPIVAIGVKMWEIMNKK